MTEKTTESGNEKFVPTCHICGEKHWPHHMLHVGTNFSSWDPFVVSVISKPPCSFCSTLSPVWIHTLLTGVLIVRLSRQPNKVFGLGFLSSQLIALLRPAIRHQLNSGSCLIGTEHTAKSLIHNRHIAK